MMPTPEVLIPWSDTEAILFNRCNPGDTVRIGDTPPLHVLEVRRSELGVHLRFAPDEVSA